MKAYEIIKALMEGRKVRYVDWIKDRYIYLKNNSTVIDDEGNESVALLRLFDREREIHDDRKELPEQLRWLKDAYKFFEYGNCYECEKCPLSFEYYENEAICDIMRKYTGNLNKEYKID